MAAVIAPAIPSTPAQHGRYDRVLQAATVILRAQGEDGLQMKELSQRAGISLATLYRYFPAKDHVLLAIALSRYQAAYRQVCGETARGATVRERVTHHLLREFRAQQRERRLTAALSRVLSETSRCYSEVIERIEQAHLQVIGRVAGSGGPVSDQQRRMLPVTADVFAAASRRWLAGVCPAAEARFEITVGCRLLDLPDSVIEEDVRQAAPASALAMA
jgi:AcrR family transcriptional regulator